MGFTNMPNKVFSYSFFSNISYLHVRSLLSDHNIFFFLFLVFTSFVFLLHLQFETDFQPCFCLSGFLQLVPAFEASSTIYNDVMLLFVSSSSQGNG